MKSILVPILPLILFYSTYVFGDDFCSTVIKNKPVWNLTTQCSARNSLLKDDELRKNDPIWKKIVLSFEQQLDQWASQNWWSKNPKQLNNCLSQIENDMLHIDGNDDFRLVVSDDPCTHDFGRGRALNVFILGHPKYRFKTTQIFDMDAYDGFIIYNTKGKDPLIIIERWPFGGQSLEYETFSFKINPKNLKLEPYPLFINKKGKSNLLTRGIQMDEKFSNELNDKGWIIKNGKLAKEFVYFESTYNQTDRSYALKKKKFILKNNYYTEQ